MNINPDKIEARLQLTREAEMKDCPPPPGLSSEPNQPAAVLIPLLNDGVEWKILFIKRTQQQEDRHSGQVAFPGGRVDARDPSLEATALREAAEEIGLAPEAVRILGRSCPVTTVTGYQITPIVGLLPWPIPLTLSAAEVEKTLLFPLDWLIDPANHRTELWQSPFQPGTRIPVVFFNEFQGEILWGASARILLDFLEIVQLFPACSGSHQG
jgi:8-oxo-dGTP pyrophosphatase MutT (NUDIX family)